MNILNPGSSFKPIDFTPGHYANAIQKTISARHAMNVIRTDSTSVFILELSDKGSALLCRGWRYLSTNDGPAMQNMEHIREQLSYRGTWTRDGQYVEINLRLEEKEEDCPRIAEYSHLVPKHAAQWTLRGMAVQPTDHPTLKAAVLLCQLQVSGPLFGEDEPHIVADLVPGGWIVLAAGSGLQIWLKENRTSPGGKPTVDASIAPEPLDIGAWEKAF